MFKEKKSKKSFIALVVVCTILTVYFPISMAVCCDQLIVNPGGPYFGSVNATITLRIEIIGGFPPFIVFIDWKDGTNNTFRDINESIYFLFHVYTSPGIYNVAINVTDSEKNTDWSQTTVIISEQKCELEIEIEIEHYYCTLTSGTKIWVRVMVHNYGECFCDDYNVRVVINPGNITIDDIQERPIGSGGDQEYLIQKFLSIDNYTVFANLSSNCGDDKIDNDKSDELPFYVLPNWLCRFLDKLPDKIIQSIDDFLDSIIKIIKRN